MVTKLDNYVGEVVAKLKALGLDQNTLIVFASDNGPHAEGGNDPAFFNSSGGFTGIKRKLNEGGIREPMIINWKGKIKAGQTSKYVGAFWDFLPTFADIAGTRLPQKTDGISLLPLLSNKGKQQEHDFLYWEFHEDGGRQALRMGKWKAIREKVFSNPNGALKLYNLENDPQEKADLAAVNPDIVVKMNEIMVREHVENKNFPFFGQKSEVGGPKPNH
jgi:arylsulfatase A-like enzyme